MNSKKTVQAVVGLLIIIIAAFFFFRGDIFTGKDSTSKSGDLRINKNEVTAQAKFYPYQAGNTGMEVLAVKAQDGSIRTAFNTCQVCYSSGRGYYEQEGEELVCQNCGNRFNVNDVEVVRGGCNPVPIFEENKSEDGTDIVIAESFLEQNKDLFNNWKQQ